jgi:hypothetical protein
MSSFLFKQMVKGINVGNLWKKLDVNRYCYSHGQAMDMFISRSTLYSWPSSKGLVYVQYLLDQSAGFPINCQPVCCLSVYHSLTYLPVCPPALHVCLSGCLPPYLSVFYASWVVLVSVCLPACPSSFRVFLNLILFFCVSVCPYMYLHVS